MSYEKAARILAGQGDPVKASPEQFRSALKHLMPGYKWTVHKRFFPDSDLVATGTQSSGSNRLSTLQVSLNVAGRYTVKSSGYGVKTPWQSNATAATLAQALRLLQKHYEAQAATYNSLATAMQRGRTV